MINFLSGPEGAGKTAFMTFYARKHHLLGGEVWAFPGYELLNQRGNVVSKLIYPDEVMGMIDDMQYVVLCVDEIENFLNHHDWSNPFHDVMASAAAQRRKRGFNILATGPEIELVSKDLRAMFHEIVYCKDMHWRNHAIPRGKKIWFVREDRRGVLSGYPGTRTRPKIFKPEPYFKYYDTFSLVDQKYRHHRIKIQKEVTLVDANGNVIEQEGMPDQATLDRYIQEYQSRPEYENPLHKAINYMIRKFKEQGITTVENAVFFEAVGGNKTYAGKYLKSIGVLSNKNTKMLDLSSAMV